MNKPEQTSVRRNPLLDSLCTAFAVFRDGRPLALGIHKTIRERLPETDAGQLRTAMRIHTASTRYLKALAQGGPRFDLDGKPAGEVTAEQREQAAGEVRERFRKSAEKRKAELEAQQSQAKLLKLAEKFNSR